LDKAEDVLKAREGEELDHEDWREILLRYPEPDTKLEAIRQQIVGVCMKEIILRQITDWFERSKHRDNGKFEYRWPCLNIGVGRAKA
jgi:hypothetical protein